MYLLIYNVPTRIYTFLQIGTYGHVANAQSLREWVLSGAVISFIVLIMQCFAFGTFLKHLYCKTYQYSTGYEPSSKVKSSAIIYSISQLFVYLMVFIISFFSFTLCKSNALKSIDIGYLKVQYPALYVFTCICYGIFTICFIISTFGLFPLHLVFRLQDITKQDDIMRRLLPSKKINCILYFGIFIQFVTGIGVIITILVRNSSGDATFATLVVLFVFLWCIIDILIHAILLYGYLKGLWNCSQHTFHSGLTDDQLHEMTIEVTRYCVLFTIYMIIIVFINIIFMLLQIQWNSKWFDENSYMIVNTMLLFCFAIRDIVSLVVVFFSFKFSHRWYKDIFCGTCDQKMGEICQNKVKETNVGKRAALLSMQENAAI